MSFLTIVYLCLYSTLGFTQQVNVELLAVNGDRIERGEKQIAIYFEIEPEWHLYWKNPGDSGSPIKLTWNLPSGVEAGSVKWPAPLLIQSGPFVSYGIENEALLLATLKASKGKRLSELEGQLKIDWLVCKEDCLPGSVELALNEAVFSNNAKEGKSLIDRLSKAFPLTDTLIELLAVEEQQDNILIKLKGLNTEQLDPASFYFFPEQEDIIEASAAQNMEISNGIVSLRFKKALAFKNLPSSLSGVLCPSDCSKDTATGRIAGYPLSLDLESAEKRESRKDISLFMALFFAFIGGIILNIMPCVFPILAIKALSLVEQAHQERKSLFLNALSFVLGVLFSMWVLAGILIALRMGGARLGWGFQLQSPLIVILLIYLFSLISFNLFGALNIGQSFVNKAGSLSLPRGHLGSFFSGVLTTVIATPCTAPFMGVAIGYSLLQGSIVALLVFTFLGLGIAAPYFVLSLNPTLVSRLPKPGGWMNSFKQFLAFPILATIVWLFSVLGEQLGSVAIVTALSGLLLIALAVWIHFVLLEKGQRKGVFSRLVISLSLIVAGYLAIKIDAISRADNITPNRPEQLSSTDEFKISWVPFSNMALKEARKSGRPVFIDYTASWCLTCKLNKYLVFSSDEVKQRFIDEDFIMIKADWTNRDPAITASLASFGRAGVPFNVIYGPEEDAEPIVLPTLLRPGIVLNAIDEALGASR